MPPAALFTDLILNLEGQGGTVAAAQAEILLKRILLAFRMSTDLPDKDAMTALLYARLGLVRRSLLHFGSSRDALLEAIELHPGFPPYLHSMAALLEKNGDYSDASRHLSILVKVSPDDASGRLRLALVERRLGRARKARDHLEILVGRGDGTAWVREIAFQELARLRVEMGEEEAALELLLDGVEAYPESQALALELSLFARGTRHDPVAVLEAEVLSWKEDQEVSPRVLYNEWPMAEMDPFEEDWGRALRQTRAALAEALPLLRITMRGKS